MESAACDSVEAQNAAELRYPVELLNSIEFGASLLDYEIALKKRLIVMLRRNIKPSSGHVNGTRCMVDNMILMCSSSRQCHVQRLEKDSHYLEQMVPSPRMIFLPQGLEYVNFQYGFAVP